MGTGKLKPHKKLVQLNNTGTFSGQGRTKTSNPGSSLVILCGAERFDIMEKYTAHNPINDGDTVFFATYRVGVGVDEKIYADFIEPYFQSTEELVLSQV